MSSDTLIPILIVSCYAVMMVSERIWPARRFPHTKWWIATGLGFFVLTIGLNSIVPLLLPTGWIASHSLMSGERLGLWGGIVVGFPIVALFTALVHRALHRSNFLWRWSHQMHHAPERIDIPGAVLFHPFDIAQGSVVSLVVTVFVLGLNAEAAAWLGFVQVFYALFQHWNVKTPQFLGYVIQRPESHCIHHQRDVHAYNYSDFPLWDIVMGSFRNPREWAGQAGFEPERARHYGMMLIGRDVNPGLDNGGAATSFKSTPDRAKHSPAT